MSATKKLSINFHITEKCNMSCKYCFAKYSEQTCKEKSLSLSQYRKIIKQISVQGFSKISFAGGEPLLHPLLPELISYAKELGLTTMLVTNGSLLTESFIERVSDVLDWISISIDSLEEQANLKIGRILKGRGMNEKAYRDKIALIHKSNMRFKINTVVSSANAEEYFADFINEIAPERWKIFQALPIDGVNIKRASHLFINREIFQSFVNRNKHVDTRMVAEDNNDMIDSYVMIDPYGRLYGNSDNIMSYSKPLYEYSLEKALHEQGFSHEKFLKRDGVYDWEDVSIKIIPLKEVV